MPVTQRWISYSWMLTFWYCSLAVSSLANTWRKRDEHRMRVVQCWKSWSWTPSSCCCSIPFRLHSATQNFGLSLSMWQVHSIPVNLAPCVIEHVLLVHARYPAIGYILWVNLRGVWWLQGIKDSLYRLFFKFMQEENHKLSPRKSDQENQIIVTLLDNLHQSRH